MVDMTAPNLRVTQVAAPLRQQVGENIRAAITSGRFKPGERLIERELCDLSGVSRTAIREALRQLESEGLVENIANRGPVVATITREIAIGIYEVRGALEALTGRLFTERASDAQVKQLRVIVDRLAKAYSAGDVAKILKVKGEFYGKLLDGAQNVIVDTMLRTIHARANFLRTISLSQPNRWQASSSEIQEIMTAIEARQAGEVARHFDIHVKKASDAALQTLR